MIALAMAVVLPQSQQTAPAPTQAEPGRDASAGPDAAPPSAATDAAQGTPNAQPPSTTSPARPRSQQPRRTRLLGDWGGALPVLKNIGIVPTVTYVGQTVGNLRGGERKVVRHAGQLVTGINLDLETIAGVPGDVQMSLNRRDGASFNADSGLRALVNPQTIQGRGEIWRVSQFWYHLKRGAFDLKLGRMQLNEDFDRARCDFVGGYLCQGENVRVSPTSWVNTPISQWGGRVIYKPAPNVELKAGVFQYNPRNLDATRELFFGWEGGTGVTVPAEISYSPKLGGTLPGTYTVGLVYTDGEVNDAVLNRAGQIRLIYGGSPLMRGPQWGAYVVSRQQVTTPRANGSHALSIFFNLSTFTRKTARNESAFGVGLNYTGPIPGRPKDEIGFGFGSARVNDRVTDATRLANAIDGRNRLVPTREYGFEAYYGITVVPGLVVQPGLQYIVDPGGLSERRNAILAEIKTSITL